jgi:hypothetical protein
MQNVVNEPNERSRKPYRQKDGWGGKKEYVP